LPAACPEAAADPWNDWRELAKPLRIGPGGVAMALRAIEKLSIRQVVTQICDKLKRAAAALGADADLVRIAALEAAALALCPEAEPAAEIAPGDAAKDVAKDGAKYGAEYRATDGAADGSGADHVPDERESEPDAAEPRTGRDPPPDDD
jgi:hypothetical protein